MKEKTLNLNYVAETNVGGKSVIELFSGLDQKGEVSDKFVSDFKYLESISSEIEIKINSSGGSVMSGLNIVSAILDCQIPTTTRIVGVAASMASVIALAADKTVMADYALLMWHNPYSPTGDAENDQLTAFSGMLKTIYKNRLGKNDDEIEAFMSGDEGKDGTWFNASKAMEFGLISGIEETGIQKSLEENLSVLTETITADEIVSELHLIAAELVINTKEKQDDTELEAAVVVVENESASVTKNKKNMSTVSLENISASLNIENADLEAINAKVKDIVASNKSLEGKVAKTNEKLVAATTTISEKDVEIASVSAELETANVVKLEAEAKVDGLVAEIEVFKAEKAEAHTLVITDLVNEAADAGKITTEMKEHWTGLLVASFDFAKEALAGLTSSEAKKVKLSDRVAPVVAEVVVEEEDAKDVAPKAVFVSMEAKLAEIKANRKKG